jgi:hypothetical protein
MPDKETTNPENISPIPAPVTPTVEPTTTTTSTTSVTASVSETSTVPVVEEVEEDIDQENIEELTKDKSFKNLLAAVPKRILELIIKVVGGKGAVLAVGTYLFIYTEKIPLWAWLLLVVIFIGGRYADKLIDRLTPKGTF